MNYKLAEICEFINGGAWSDKEYADKGIPVLKVSNMQSDGFNLSSLNYIPESSRSKYQKHILERNDLVIATVGSHPSLVNSAAGRSSKISESVTGFLLNQNAVCLRSRNNELIDQKYLGYLGKTSFFQHYIQQRGRGAANQMRIAIGAIKDFEFDFPNIETQRRIASILSAYDDLTENNLRRIKLLEETLQLLFYKLLSESESLPSLIYPTIANFEKGLEPGSKNYFEQSGDGLIPFIRVGDLSSRDSGIYIRDNLKGIKIARIKDVLISMDATIGVVKIGMHGAYSSGIRKVVVKNEFYKAFIYSFLKSKIGQAQIMTYAKGSTILHASSCIPKLKTRLPNINKSKLELILMNNCFDEIITLINQNRLLNESRDILLPRLMGGVLEVEDSIN